MIKNILAPNLSSGNARLETRFLTLASTEKTIFKSVKYRRRLLHDQQQYVEYYGRSIEQAGELLLECAM
jgi:hypothetical protein